MRKRMSNLLYCLAFGLVCCFAGLFLRICCGDASEKENASLGGTLIRTDTVRIPGDSFPFLVYDTVSQPVATVPLAIPVKPDYDSVLRAFFLSLTYADTVLQDSSFRIIYRLNMSKNRLDSLKLYVQNLRPVALVTNQYAETKAVSDYGFYLGASMGGSSQHFVFAPGLMYQDRKSRLYQLQYDFIGKQFLAGIHFKVK